MKKMFILKKIQYYKNLIDEYTGPDPLKPRYEFIMWLEQNVGQEKSDANTCLEQTLQIFEKDSRYSNDTRFVELLILFTRLKGNKLSYFKKLYECKLGFKCSIFYKAWSDEYIINKKFIEAYDVLKTGIYCQAEPMDILMKGLREIEASIGKKVLMGSSSCELLKIPCVCYKRQEKEEGSAVINWEWNPLKPGEPDNFTCLVNLPELDDPNKIPMYAKHLVHQGTGEYQLEEIMAQQYLAKIQRSEAKTHPDTDDCDNPVLNPSSSHSLKDSQQLAGDVSCAAQSFTAHTKVALNLVQGMWESPSSGSFKPKENFKIPEVQKSLGRITHPAVYNDSVVCESENIGQLRNSNTNQKSLKTHSSGEDAPISIEKGTAKHQLIFGGGIENETHPEEELATNLDPSSKPIFSGKGISNNWNVEDITCNTKVFNNFLAFSSTPNMKAKENFPTPQPGSHRPVVEEPKSEAAFLSVIFEASKETPGSGSSGNENKPPNILEIERTIGNLDINGDPFCPKLIDHLLKKVNYPYNLDQNAMQGYHIVNTRLPNITKTLKLGDNIYSLTGESFKGSYAKVLKVTRNNQVYALKIEKPACHWEFYISKEIRKRLDLDNLKYFADISNAYFFQNGSIFVSNYAKYGTLLNVINQYKLSTSKVDDTSVWLFFCIEVISAVYYLHNHCNIIHADIKPDNFVVHNLPNLSNNGPCVQLIDFGRAIDMTILPKGSTFNYVITTDGFQCNEMKENKPWTYQTDLYGLAGTIYCILVGDYMKVIKKKDTYVLTKPLSRIHRTFWNPIFNSLLNIESCDTMPDLMEIKNTLQASYDNDDPFTIRYAFTSLGNILNGN